MIGISLIDGQIGKILSKTKQGGTHEEELACCLAPKLALRK